MTCWTKSSAPARTSAAEDLAISATPEDAEEQQAELQRRLDKIEDERRDIIDAARRQAEDELKDFQRELKRLRNDMRAAVCRWRRSAQVQDAASDLNSDIRRAD